MRPRLFFALALTASMLVNVAVAQANRALLTEKILSVKEVPGTLEGPCGVALSPGGEIYVSAYYPHAIDAFTEGNSLAITESAEFIFRTPVSTVPEGPCQLAASPSGVLYANRWHEGVERVLPSSLVFDEAESTGVGLDAAGNVYVDDRTKVEVYDASGTPLRTIATDPSADYYGLAISGEKAYLADAADETVKVFETDGSLAGPIAKINGSTTPEGEFVSLTDASLATDPTNGHLLVMDNLQPGFVHPRGAIYEFDSTGKYLGKLGGNPIDGGPSGMVVKSSSGTFFPPGTLYITSGNSEEGKVFTYGTYSEAPSPAPGGSGSGSGAVAVQDEGSSSAFSSPRANAPAALTGSASKAIKHRRKRIARCASKARIRVCQRRDIGQVNRTPSG